MKIFGMRFFDKAKDGGPQSTVTGWWLVEIKWLFSIALLKFDLGSRDAYHSHAFHSLNWILRGFLREDHVDGVSRFHDPSWWRPVLTLRSTFHRVFALRTSWVLTIRGPWSRTWNEYLPKTGQCVTLTHGREIVDVTL